MSWLSSRIEAVAVPDSDDHFAGQFLHDYRTFCTSPKAEPALQILEAMPVLAAVQ